jgi:hypothetical protein
MDDNVVAARSDTTAPADPVLAIDDVEVSVFSAVVARLSADYPAVTTTRIESILLREWEAFSAGRPLVVPVAVEAGVREILDER